MRKIVGKCGVFEQDESGLYLQVHTPSSSCPRVKLEDVVSEIGEWGLQNIDAFAIEEAVKFPGKKFLIGPSQDKKIFLKKSIVVDTPQESYLELNAMADGIYARVCRVGNKLLNINKAIEYVKASGIEDFSQDAIKECLAREGFWIKIAPLSDTVKKDGELLVKLSEDKMICEITVFPPLGGDSISCENVKAALLRYGIVCGWDEDELDVLCEIGGKKKATLIIKGDEPSPGDDAKIEYVFEQNIKLKPREMEDGRVDYRELGTIIKVHKGDVLARKIPPSRGRGGKTLTGEKIEGTYGKDINFPQGKGTIVSDDGWSLLAAIDGGVSIIGNKICVLPVCEVKDVDFSVGNIDFPGNVKISGSIKSGFKVKAGGNVDIRGNIENAEVVCSGKLNVHGGIFGSSSCKVSAEDDITCKFIINANVFSSSNIKVQDEIMHSTVVANKKISTVGKKGSIVGGKIVAGEEIATRLIGSKYATLTEIEVGVLPQVRKELKEVEKTIEVYKKNMALLKEAILRLEDEQKKTGLSYQKKHTLIKLIRQQYSTMESLNKAQIRKSELDELVEKAQNARVIAQEMIYPGVKITIKRASLKITEPMKNSVFLEEDGEIKTRFQKVAKKSTK